MRDIFSNKSSCPKRFLLPIILSVIIIIADSNYIGFLVKLRTSLDNVFSPSYIFINYPNKMINYLSTLIISKRKLVIEKKTEKQLLLTNSELLKLAFYKQENDRLKKILHSTAKCTEKKIIANVVLTTANSLPTQIIIDQGIHQGVYIGQPVLDQFGIIGQVISVGNTTSRVMLICDSLNEIPVQDSQNNLLIACGKGCGKYLKIKYLPSNQTDLNVGDILLTSNVGGHFPEGYPVLIIAKIIFNKPNNKIIIYAYPIADLDNLRHVLLLWPQTNNYNKHIFQK